MVDCPLVERPVHAEEPRTAFWRRGPEAFGAYHDLYASGSTVLRTEDAFSAAVTAHNVSGLLMFDRQVTGAIHQRDAARVRRDGFDHYNLQILRSGRMMGGAWGNEGPLSPGDAILFDTTCPQRTLVTSADYLTIAMPRDLLESALPDARALHGLVLPEAASRLLHAAVRVLAHRSPVLDGGRIIAGVLAGVGGSARGRPAADAMDDLESKRFRAAAFIEGHLARPDLDVAAVAAGSGMSRSTLYRAFAAAGGVEREILRRRVARLRVAMLRPGETRPLSGLARAVGFSSESHGSRAFKAAYGWAPTRIREEARRDRDDGGRGLDPERMRDWFGIMRVGRTAPAPRHAS